jgi:hypothetical protein
VSQSGVTKHPEPVPLELLGDTFVRCGCGFAARSSDQNENSWALKRHTCFGSFPKPARVPLKWYESMFDNIFSFWGFAIVFMAGSVLMKVFG